MNSITLTGRITQDLEVRKVNDNTSVLNFSIAVKRETSDDKADFIEIETWRQSADYLGNYASKGTTIGVTGKLRQDKFTGRDGQERRKVYVLADRVEILNQPRNSEKKTVEQENQEFGESLRDTAYEDKFGSYSNGMIEEKDLPFY